MKQGDRIVILMPNCLEYIYLYMGASKQGIVQVPVNTAYHGAFLEHQINISEAETVVVAYSFLENVVNSLGNLPAIKRLVVWCDSDADMPELPTGLHCEVLRYQDLYSHNSGEPEVVVKPQDLAVIIFTSGTTGLSKGVLMTHAQAYLFSEQGAQLMALTPDDTYMTVLPLFHGNAQFLTVYCSMIVGARCVLYQRFSASEWAPRLYQSGATVMNCVSSMLAFALAQPPSELDSKLKLRCVLAAPTPWDIVDELKKRFGIQHFVEGYGQTEINLVAVTPIGWDRPRGAVGLAADQWYELRVVDPETDQDVALGEVGELLVRPRVPWTLNQGYVGMPAETLTAFRNLWFHTGDAVKQDAQGWLYFLDRYKDTLRRRGENISSFEVEAPIRQHPAVADVAVVAVAAQEAGGEDEVKACVMLKEGAVLDPAELIEWCEASLPYFAVPRYIDFYDAFPTSASDKIQKNVLRDEGVRPSTWDRVAAGVQLQFERKKARA